LTLADPTVEAVLNRLSSATKLTFVTETDIDTSTPVFASINWVNVPIWAAMEDLAQSSLINGHWEKTDTGNRLSALPASARTAGRFPWVYFSAGVLASLAFACGVLFIYRRRVKKTSVTRSQNGGKLSPAGEKKIT
jgi:hypothetical protein